MRIGKFAKHNSLTIDTLRHYMDLGLIVPEKNGSHYFFDERCQKDLELILEYKGMGFSLNEIKTIFLYKNLGEFTAYEDDAYYQSLYKNKFKQLENEIENLIEVKSKLEKKMDQINKRTTGFNSVMGVDLSVLDKLRCVTCKGILTLEDGMINRNQILEGKLSCSCGSDYKIEEGIMIVGEPILQPVENPLNHFVFDYLHMTDPVYLENVQKGGQWTKRKLAQCDLSNKVILEPGSGVGFLLRSIYQDLPENCLYIAVDRNLDRQRFLKNVLERTGLKRNILFICSDFLSTPIQDRSVDIVMDHAGTSNYSFEHETFLLKDIDYLIKQDALLLASYIVFKNFDKNSKIEACYRNHFKMDVINEELYKLGYRALEERISDSVDKGGKYEDYFVEGEEVFCNSFFGKR
ncbi:MULTISPECIES: MerR family transcriptional regulator [unclassified Bacillus (in: firmicutes)]|uniref:MerR family transcriptional regulator n=1 Tax=unclassified Bacillus (in: firmicutes) TaxID=185979 RepID=UPI0008E36282|nr:MULTISPECIES: MerR family transcriptional regulator [unclassified Bacillus (in: firmicutes)]SFB09246.1 DNA-binding transcriptional regulator, MerR family [Bacillus sp. UNCCL13]SFQ86794.1 DNA-binding transcriptional regulator, MerR family [Bacillus sp. cl95]